MRAKNKVMIGVLTGILCAGSSFSAMAGSWQRDFAGWWWQENDGSYPINTWKEINGKQYYFGANGYMLADTTTPDGYKVGADGAWIQSTKYSDKEMEIFKGSYTDEQNRSIGSGHGVWLTILEIKDGKISGDISIGAGTSTGETYASFKEELDDDNSIKVVMEGFTPVRTNAGYMHSQDCADKVQICFLNEEGKKKIVVKGIELGYGGLGSFELLSWYLGDNNQCVLFEMER